MDNKLPQEIERLKKAIKAEEEKVALATQNSDDDTVSKSLASTSSQNE
ncbi:MAG: hypothetical protein JRZ95_05360, partial [Nitrososphaerota archaeon]|nr:hypothetical protein [Nitrososphaerota archaeon]